MPEITRCFVHLPETGMEGQQIVLSSRRHSQATQLTSVRSAEATQLTTTVMQASLDHEAFQRLCLHLSKAKWHLPQQRRQTLRRVLFLFRCRPSSTTCPPAPAGNSFLRCASCTHNSLIDKCRTFPDPVLVHIPRAALPVRCNRSLSSLHSRSVSRSVRFASMSPRP